MGWGQVGVPGGAQRVRLQRREAASRLGTPGLLEAVRVGGRPVSCRQTPAPNASCPPRPEGQPWGLQPRLPPRRGSLSHEAPLDGLKYAGKRKCRKSHARPGSGGSPLCGDGTRPPRKPPFPLRGDAHCPSRPPAAPPWMWEVAGRGPAAQLCKGMGLAGPAVTGAPRNEGTWEQLAEPFPAGSSPPGPEKTEPVLKARLECVPPGARPPK